MAAGFGDWRACAGTGELVLAPESWLAILDGIPVLDSRGRARLHCFENTEGCRRIFKDLLGCAQWDLDIAILEHDIFCNDNFLNDPSAGLAGEVAELS